MFDLATLTMCTFEVNLGLSVAVIRFRLAPFQRLEVFSPSGAAGILLQSLFFGTSENGAAQCGQPKESFGTLSAENFGRKTL